MRFVEVPLLIIAGGRATRLGALSDDVPKFLVPVGRGRVFADVQLAWAREHGFRQVRLAVGYRAGDIEAYCGDGSRYGLQLAYAYDGDEALGTGGAVKRAFADPPPWIAVLYGDTILDLDCQDVIDVARTTDANAVMTALENPPPGQPCNLTLDGDRVTYSKSNPDPAWRFIDYGFLVVSRRFLAAIPAPPVDLAVALESASAAGLVRGVKVTARFWEINTPESLGEFRRRFGGD